MADGALARFVTGVRNLKESRGRWEEHGGWQRIYDNWRTRSAHRAAQSNTGRR